jgi:hypothetical protein
MSTSALLISSQALSAPLTVAAGGAAGAATWATVEVAKHALKTTQRAGNE